MLIKMSTSPLMLHVLKGSDHGTFSLTKSVDYLLVLSSEFFCWKMLKNCHFHWPLASCGSYLVIGTQHQNFFIFFSCPPLSSLIFDMAVAGKQLTFDNILRLINLACNVSCCKTNIGSFTGRRSFAATESAAIKILQQGTCFYAIDTIVLSD